MKILITGGNGYVGRTLTRLLIKEHSVCVVDNERYGVNRFTAEELEFFDFIKVDIRNREKLADIINNFQPEAIIHLAAIHYIPECESFPDLTNSINIEGTVNLLVLCPSNCRFVFASSGAVYSPQESPHDEIASPLQPMDVYGFTKLHGEDYVKYFAKLKSFPAVIVRLFNVVGPGETNPHLLPEIFAQLTSGIRLLKLGNLSPKRDYIDVRDAARGFWSVTAHGEVPAGTVKTINLGTMKQYSVSELLDKLRQISGIDFDIEQDQTRIRKVDRPYLLANNSRIKEFCNWEPKFNIDDTIAAMINDPDLAPSLLKKYNLKTYALTEK